MGTPTSPSQRTVIASWCVYDWAKVTAFLGPWFLATLSDVYSQRVGVFSGLLFLVVGGLLLLRVDEGEGIRTGALRV